MTLRHSKSHEAYQRARRVIPGGVDSPVRAFTAVGGSPLVVERASGAYVFDIDGNRYIDYVMSWGPLILGHAHPGITDAIAKAARNGTSFGLPTEQETELAERVVAAYPSVEQVRFVNSGTEAVMSAIRLARAYTSRDVVVKFDGCYHGHSDGLLVQAGSGGLTFGVPSSPGVPHGFAELTISLPYNSLERVEEVCRVKGNDIACIIVEPVAGNMGVVAPSAGFLEGLRRLASRYGIVLVFDEVITGYRLARGGAQERFGIEADMTTLGKVIGGGVPVGAYGGPKEIMKLLSPDGPVYQAGTLSGNPLAMAAGLAAVSVLERKGVYEQLERSAGLLEAGMRSAARDADVPVQINRVGSMMSAFFVEREVTDVASAQACDVRRFSRYFAALLAEGILIAPSQFEAMFVSLAHTEADIESTVAACRKALAAVRGLREG